MSCNSFFHFYFPHILNKKASSSHKDERDHRVTTLLRYYFTIITLLSTYILIHVNGCYRRYLLQYSTPRGIQSSNITFFHQPKALYLCFNHLLLLFTVFIFIKPLHHLFVKVFLYLLIYLIKDIAYYDDIFLIKLFSFYLNKLKLSNFLPIIK